MSYISKFLSVLGISFFFTMVFSLEKESFIDILSLLKIEPSQESVKYVNNKKQFQLHTLLTEQSHSKTQNLSSEIEKSYEVSLQSLFAVDEDISLKLKKIIIEDKKLLEEMVSSLEKTLLEGNKVYFYGCGATGRLCKQMESVFWRPFWLKVKKQPKLWNKIKKELGDDIEERLIGDMTGGDRALISSLEGFEDSLLIGKLQLEDRIISSNDMVICITEGGETSSVIGTILAAAEQRKNQFSNKKSEGLKKLFFVFNNPEECLYSFERSRKVLEEKAIVKINLTTGPQAITGSTRMQASTIETFVCANVIHISLRNILKKIVSSEEMQELGFDEEKNLEDQLKEFPKILNSIKRNIPKIAKLTAKEAHTYEKGKFVTYFAKKAALTTFTDLTERSPTFRLFPLDTIEQKKKKCWVQLWLPASNKKEAWQNFLKRSFRGLSSENYQPWFEKEEKDVYLQKASLNSLKKAGKEQQDLYDFSFSDFNLKYKAPLKDDLGVIVLLDSEWEEIQIKNSYLRKFMDLFNSKENFLSFIMINKGQNSLKNIPKIYQEHCVIIDLDNSFDPLEINQHMALKMVLNAHSTAVMTKLGKVVGNTMTNVSPSNLKLIGRATFLIWHHVNSQLENLLWKEKHGGIGKEVTYAEANAVLFDTIAFLKEKKTDQQISEVAFSIIRILETLRLKKEISYEKILEIMQEKSLDNYLKTII